MSARFLEAHGYGTARQELMQADASKRYTRLTGGPRGALLMQTPDADYLAAFLRVARHLDTIGVPAPAVIAVEEAQNLALVEDLGAASMAEALDAGAEAAPLYLDAVRSMARLHAAPAPEGLPAWDAEAMSRTAAATFLDWWWPAVFGATPSDAVRGGLHTAIRQMFAPFAASGIVHRDFFPANLIPTPRGMALIDFQDAAIGHSIYDLVSLAADARRAVAAPLRETVIREYLALRPGVEATSLRAAMAAHGAQRHLRVAALWVRLERRDGKPHYLAHGPRCWALLGRALEHEAAAPLAHFLDAHVPRALRKNPA